jgi:glycosyltransferase involved in cell wall biosynthesis
MMGNKGRERISNHFSIKRMSEEYVKVYEEVMSLKK